MKTNEQQQDAEKAACGKSPSTGGLGSVCPRCRNTGVKQVMGSGIATYLNCHCKYGRAVENCQDEVPSIEEYYCQCNAQATQEEFDWNKCSACGKQLW